MRFGLATTRMRWLVAALAGLIALSGIMITSASHGVYTDYYADEWVTSINGGDTSFSQWIHVYHAHNSSSSVQLNETSQWTHLYASPFGSERFTFDHHVENGPGTYYYDHSPTWELVNVGNSWNQRYNYYGMWVNKGGGSAYVRTTVFLGEWGVYHKVYHDIDFRSTYICHGAYGSNGSTSTC
jgi:hypothetical protein